MYQAFTPIVPEAPQPRHITILAFDNRFTDLELAAIDLAAIDVPFEDDGVTPVPKSDQRRVQAAIMRARMKKSEKATYIDLDRPDTRAGVQQFETFGLIGPGRALEILDAPIQDHERFRG